MNLFLQLTLLIAVSSTVNDTFVARCSEGDAIECITIIDTVDRTALEPAYLAACANCHTHIVQMFHERQKMPYISKETRVEGLRSAISNNCHNLVLRLVQQDEDGLYKIAVQCASLGNSEMLKEIFENGKFRSFRHRAGLIQSAIRGNHVEVVQYLLQNAKYWPRVFVNAFKSACTTRSRGLIEPFLKCDAPHYWSLQPRAILHGLLSTGSLPLLELAMENVSFVTAFEACDSVIIREVMYLIFIRVVTAGHAELGEWSDFLKNALNFRALSSPITSLRVFDLAMELDRSWLLLSILHRCPNINLKSELGDHHYKLIIDTRFLGYLLPFILLNEVDLRYLMLCVSSHDYKEKPHKQKKDMQALYEYARNFLKIPMAARMNAAQHTYLVTELALALRLIDDDEDGDRLAKIQIARDYGNFIVEKYLSGVHLTCSLYIPSDEHEYWLPQEIKHYIVQLFLASKF